MRWSRARWLGCARQRDGWRGRLWSCRCTLRCRFPVETGACSRQLEDRPRRWLSRRHDAGLRRSFERLWDDGRFGNRAGRRSRDLGRRRGRGRGRLRAGLLAHLAHTPRYFIERLLLEGEALLQHAQPPPHPPLRDQSGDRQRERDEKEKQAEKKHFVSTSASRLRTVSVVHTPLHADAWNKNALL